MFNVKNGLRTKAALQSLGKTPFNYTSLASPKLRYICRSKTLMQTLKQLQSGELKGAISLKLSEELTHFPEEIFDLADTLELLDLSRNKLSSLPPHFGRLHKLKIFFCSDNLFTTLPEVLADCKQLDIVGFKANIIDTVPARSVNPNLRWLILTNNRIAKIPPEIGQCARMQKLMLAGNRLTTLPPELSLCQNLGLLRISANQLAELPQWLLQMPKLSWLAFSGNPFCGQPAITAPQLIDWNTLQIGKLLGEGASGMIYKAVYQSKPGENKEVALKIFKGDVTSDGYPNDEMNACIAVGTHPGLVEVLGQITNHPDGKKGLVLGLIPPHYYNLGITPSFESCTRDVFKPGLQLSITQIANIANTIASVGAHLHSRGIMHADMYAHNTLIDDEGNTLFGDFGAACFYDKTDTELANGLERLEVSAFGCLLDDLIGLAQEPSHPAITKLKILRDACLQADVPARPLFHNLTETLSVMV